MPLLDKNVTDSTASISDDFVMPARSVLYPLEPYGLGNYCVESLASYIGRLAEEHRVSVMHLMTHVLGNAATRVSSSTGYLALRTVAVGNSINGANIIGGPVVERLSDFTGKHGLRGLTTIELSNLVSVKHFSRPKRAWCPGCLADAVKRNDRPYEQLIWSLRDVKACPKHGKLLIDVCPHCSVTNMRALGACYRPGFCSTCSGFLGESHGSARRATVWEVWTAGQIGRVIQFTSTGCVTRNAENFRNGLRILLNSLADGNITRLSRLISAPKNTVWMWLNSSTLPTLPYLLRLAWVGQCTLDQLLLDGETITPSITLGGSWDRRKCRKYVNWEKVRIQLEKLTNSSTGFSISSYRVARLLNVERRVMKERYPELIEKLKIRHTRFTRKRRSATRTRVMTAIRRAVGDLRGVGTHPSRRNVDRILRKRGLKFWWQPGYVAAWRQAVQDSAAK